MSDERRERYGRAIWVALPPLVESRDDVEDAADAAMTVADEEMRSRDDYWLGRYRNKIDGVEKRCDAVIRENARLRAELTALHQQCSDDREEALRLREVSDAELDRLRAELERQKKLTDAYKEGAKRAAENFHAEIQMLRNALNALEEGQ